MLTEPMTLVQALHTERFKSYADAFTKAGYKDWQSLGKKAEEAQAALASVVANEPDAAYLAQLWREWHEATGNGTKPPEPGKTPVGIPDLSPGTTFSLDAPTIQFDNVTFSIPSELATTVDQKEVTLASDVTALEWLVIARTRGLLKCIVGDRLIDQLSDPVASEAALVWRVPDTVGFAAVTDDAVVESTVAYSHHHASLVQQQIAGAAAGLATPFAGAAMKVSRDETIAKTSETKNLRLTGSYLYPRATLDADKCTALSRAFIEAVDAALDRPEHEQFAALRDVFQTYGTSYPRKIVLGGVLLFYHEEAATGVVVERTVKDVVETAVKAKYEGVEAQATGSFANGVKSKVTAQSLYQSTKFKATGGDTTLASAPKDWAPTVKSPRLWRIVERNEMTSLVDRLDVTRKTAVKQLWDLGRSIAWDGLMLPTEQAFPDMEDQAFLLNNVGLDGPLSWLYREFLPRSFAPDWASLGVGTAAQRLGEQREHRWRLLYTGYTSGDHGSGLPYYYLVADDGAYTPLRLPIVRASLEGRRAARIILEVGAPPNDRQLRVLGVKPSQMKDRHQHFVNTLSTRPVSWQPGGVSPPKWQWWMLEPANPQRSAGDRPEFYVRNLAGAYLATYPQPADDVGGPALAIETQPPRDASQQFWRWRPVSVRNA